MCSPISCDVCGAPATIHETTLVRGTARVRHLCGEHGTPHPRPAEIDPQTTAAAWEYWTALPAAEQADLRLHHRLSRRARDAAVRQRRAEQ